MAAMGAAAAREGSAAAVNPRTTSASIFAREDKFGAHNYKPVSHFVEIKPKTILSNFINYSISSLFPNRFPWLSVAARACTYGTLRERGTLISSALTRVNM